MKATAPRAVSPKMDHESFSGVMVVLDMAHCPRVLMWAITFFIACSSASVIDIGRI